MITDTNGVCDRDRRILCGEGLLARVTTGRTALVSTALVGAAATGTTRHFARSDGSSVGHFTIYADYSYEGK